MVITPLPTEVPMKKKQQFDATKVKVVAFDLFGTVFDMSGVDREEIREYVRQLKLPEWQPLKLPSHWDNVPAHRDAEEGICMLRHQVKHVVTCSNGPLGTMYRMSRNALIEWDLIIPLEINRVYKTNPKAYMTVCEVLNCEPQDVLMVTANETFGDLEASRALGMQAVLIRGDSEIEDIVQLAERLRV